MVAFTSKDVARLAGVSQSTVSYVMSGKRPISEETRRRVLDAIDRLTYEPNAGARALASQRTNVVGLVVPFGRGVDTTGLLPFIETIAGAARARDHDVLLVTTDEGSAGIRRLAGRSLCDAIILMDLHATDDERLPVAASVRTPVILIGVPEDPHGLHCVDLDFGQAARLAVDELAATGHDRLVLVGHPGEIIERDLNYVRRFYDAARVAAAGHGLPLEVVAPVEWGRAAAGETADRLATRVAGRLGVIIPASNTVQPVVHALTARGVVPGRDLSVIGLLTDAAAAEAEPPITNVSLEPRDVSRRAMETLFRLLEQPAEAPRPPRVDLVAPQLTRRQTVMPAP
ncbi:LacI family DNA-binding transcriptional regulator [Cryptosporangium aurantiacum]|uniref:Transcriptional regulator, LacI family n=1 Tax=Cryptosporangium aurantiacum TaxID=134849 RepID=A0A1M7R8V5_9ACTN|nr:LacI family DNA-binding transcriptional regulator [Cryptosporangium aurantiacum]SHN42612.1 transcriptional regulator, LacI family [Cryptosporangium aurantiacum]